MTLRDAIDARSEAEPAPIARRDACEAAVAQRPRRRWLLRAAVALAAAMVCGWLLLWLADWNGRLFFERGKQTVDTLSAMARALQSRDLETFGSFFSSSYSSPDLGLNGLHLTEQRDGIRTYRFDPEIGASERNRTPTDALNEWRDYLAGFASLEEVGLHVLRLESWRSSLQLVATVRFELIGEPNGEQRSGIDRATLRIRFQRAGPGSLQVAGATMLDGSRILASTTQFADVAHAAGVDFENRYYPAFLPDNRNAPMAFGMIRYGPGGITAADYDNDRYYDLFVPDGVESKLFRNAHDGTFRDVTSETGLGGLSGVSVGLFADYDNDGFKDFFVSRTFEPNQLFHNNGDGTFADVTERSGIGADCCTTVASWGDVDNDGWLDLYVGRYLDPRTKLPTTFYARNGEPNQLYHNNGDGTFTNVTQQAGVGEIGLCLGSAFGDYDDDGDADLFVVNDFGRKTLYRNDGDGTFTDVTVQSGTLAYGAGMSASFGDYDNDGDLDLYVAHIRSEHGWFAEWPTVMRLMSNTWRQGTWRTDMPLYMEILRQWGPDMVGAFQQMASGNTLLQNAGNGTFVNVTWQASANPPGWFWGSGFYDFDNDGWLDIYSTNGWVYNKPGTERELEVLDSVVGDIPALKSGALFDPARFGDRSWHGFERNRYLHNRGPDQAGNVTFEEVGRATGTDLLLNSRGIAVADFWNRGALDIAVAASGDRHALLRNEVGTHHNWLAVELEGAASRLADGTNRDAVGTRVEVRHGASRQIREVALGDGYGSQNTLRLYFGLGGTRHDGEAAVIDELTVRWPRSGRVQRFEHVAANRIVRIEEGRQELLPQRSP